MRRLFLFLIIFFAAVWLGLKISADPGYLLVAYQHWTVEMPLWLATVGVLLLCILFHILLRITRGVRLFPKRWHAWRLQRHNNAAQALIDQGLLALADGNWKRAQKKLTKANYYVKQPWFNYLALAIVARQQGDFDKQDKYLHRAHDVAPQAEVAVGLVQATIQYQQQKYEQALALLLHLRQLAPNQNYILRLLIKVYMHLGDWERLTDFFPTLRKKEVLPKKELDELEIQTQQNILQKVAAKNDLVALQNQWQRVPKLARLSPVLILTYAELLLRLNANDKAEELLRKTLAKNYDQKLVHCYGLIKTQARQLQIAQAWLPAHPKDPVLLLTLGRLAQNSHLWGNARSYFEASLALAPSAEAHYALGKLLEQLGEREQAMKHYKVGLELQMG